MSSFPPVACSQSGGVSVEHAQLLREKNNLQRELTSLQVALSQTKQDNAQLETDIVAMETTNRSLCRSTEEMCDKSVLLSAQSVRCGEVVGVTDEYAHRMRGRMELFK